MHETQGLCSRHKDVSGPSRPPAPARMIHLTNDKVSAYGERHTSSTCYDKIRYQCSRKDFCPYLALTPGSPSPKVLRSDNHVKSLLVPGAASVFESRPAVVAGGTPWMLYSRAQLGSCPALEAADKNQETSDLQSPFTLLSH